MKPDDVNKGIQKRDPAVYEYLMEQYSRLLWVIAAGILNGTGNREDVEDILSDVFLALWEDPARFDPQRGSIKTWLCVKTRSCAIDFLRKSCRKDLSLEEMTSSKTSFGGGKVVPGGSKMVLKTAGCGEPEAESGEDAVLEEILSKQNMTRILELIRRQDFPDREILMLRLVYEIKPSLIAAKLKLPAEEVYDRIRAGKRRLRKELEGMR